MGRPTKFNAKMQRQAKILAEKGFIDDEIAEVLGITQQTLNNWKKVHEKFFESLKKAKKIADQVVVRKLYERACGYEHPEDKIFNNNGEALIVETIKHYAPDPVSCIFWLKNRLPGEWREKKELAISADAEIMSTAVKVFQRLKKD